MERSVAHGRAPDSRADRATDRPRTAWRPILIGVALVAAALVAYTVSDPLRYYNHFVWQAEAFLEGQAAIRYPVPPTGGLPGNWFFQDVLPVTGPDGEPTGRGLIPFPPLPAIVLMPFVALWGLATDQQLLASIIGALDVGLAWWLLGRLGVRESIRLATTIFFGFGTVFWYTAQLGTTWYYAHVVALLPALLAVGLAVGADRESRFEEDDGPDADADPPDGDADPPGESALALLVRPWRLLDGRQFAIGLLFGLAATARLTIVFAAPFFVFVGSGGSWPRRAVSAGLGAVIPVGLLLAYNLASTGHVFHPAYEYLYQAEAQGYPTLGYNPDWAIEDPRYIPRNLEIMFLSMPALFPDTIPAALGSHGELCVEPGSVRALFDRDCPIALPRDVGTSILLASPAYLLAIPALALYGRSRLVTGAVLAVLLVAVVNLMHFSQGWVQFGYRFSNDFVPFALPLVALGMARRGGVGLLGWGLVGASVAMNLWGVVWGNLLGW